MSVPFSSRVDSTPFPDRFDVGDPFPSRQELVEWITQAVAEAELERASQFLESCDLSPPLRLELVRNILVEAMERIDWLRSGLSDRGEVAAFKCPPTKS